MTKISRKPKVEKTEELPLPPVQVGGVEEFPPLTIDQIIADLKGFGIEDTAELIKLHIGGRSITLRLSNIPNEWEIQALLSAEGLKGHAWVTRIKCELLSKAISWINGISIKEDANLFVTNPITGAEGHIRPVLRDMLMGWGQEAVNTLWKVLMVHCQGIEGRLLESLPETAVMTEVEKRFMENAMEEITQINRENLREEVRGMTIPDEE